MQPGTEALAVTDIIAENRQYWTGRAPSYSMDNRRELATRQREVWKAALTDRISAAFPGQDPSDIRVLEVGTGPGFFAILLAEAGYNVTAIDLTPAMLEQAVKNAGTLADSIRFLEMNAEELDFADATFDVVVSRNLTWNLPHPQEAYAEWVRVLRPGGLLMNFDANWYNYLYDEEKRAAFEEDRRNVAEAGIFDENIGDNFDVMEDIAYRVPLSPLDRPDWDLSLLDGLGVAATADTEIWETVWSDDEKINYQSTPMFLVTAGK